MIAVRPPEYFPRLEYVALLQHVDRFVLADTFPYRRQTFQDRSKIRDAQGWHWIPIPVFGQPEGAPICEVKIETGGRWQEKHWRSFLYNYRTTLYFEFFEDTLRPFFEQTWEMLGACTCRSVELLAELFEVSTRITRASALPGTPDSVGSVVREVDPDTLVAPKVFGEADALPDGVVDVQRFSYNHPTYRQNFEGFEPGMTAADLVFNYGPEGRRILAQGTTVGTPAP